MVFLSLWRTGEVRGQKGTGVRAVQCVCVCVWGGGADIITYYSQLGKC